MDVFKVISLWQWLPGKSTWLGSNKMDYLAKPAPTKWFFRQSLGAEIITQMCYSKSDPEVLQDQAPEFPLGNSLVMILSWGDYIKEKRKESEKKGKAIPHGESTLTARELAKTTRLLHGDAHNPPRWITSTLTPPPAAPHTGCYNSEHTAEATLKAPTLPERTWVFAWQKCCCQHERIGQAKQKSRLGSLVRWVHVAN